MAILSERFCGNVYPWGALLAGSLLGSLSVAMSYSDDDVSSLAGAVKQ